MGVKDRERAVCVVEEASAFASVCVGGKRRGWVGSL